MQSNLPKARIKIWINPTRDSFVRSAADLGRCGYTVVLRDTPEWEMARKWFEVNKLSFPN